MKLLQTGFAAFALLFFAVSAYAQSAPAPIKDSFYFDLGGVTPIAPDGFQNNWSTGGSAGIGYGFGLSQLFSIVVDANFSNFPLQSTQAGFPGTTYSGGGIHLFTLLVNGKLKFVAEDNPVIPYLIFGLGGQHFQSDDLTTSNGGASTTSPGVTEGDFAFRLGIGIDIKLSPGTYLLVETNGVNARTSNQVSSSDNMTYHMGRLGMKLDL
jgi:opacity protein-like surface antigen